MSRLSKKPIIIPEKTTVTQEGLTVSVKGPLGELSRPFPPSVSVVISGKEITVSLRDASREHKALSGTAVAHIKNMIAGVNKEYEKKLLIEGVGFKADAQGAKLNIALGFSHPVIVDVPKGIKVTTEKGVINISGINKDAVGQFAAKIRSLKEPEPYKGKGIRYSDEVIRRKQGKKTA
ncbi:MAG: 50S ribosomal protein L6 [Candidatus Lloydbacteria bacterium RIFCSPLOWO2_01_FULL_50_20]|uniref:Large ribosomal subunit protein uL6 n=1 Tax=Candidatus Lloydbacteria bacterium RIFCSPLOWO2_01_FULL_50_20 TaxID=1798665 RepID=A0A1G2DCY2_9BACT|nr:MAG: 50S ribosomal protein L6 [Candidatus Lloydbacteria bacterium RIFCSPHIGHO2_02_FULL_50_11]OGZ11282.1 MAG: 50S ribosomal protein L6 [Candidatus Lloydbacteria bacterium RIFCSPLOWO2_01_FULL_50_20]